MAQGGWFDPATCCLLSVCDESTAQYRTSGFWEVFTLISKEKAEVKLMRCFYLWSQEHRGEVSPAVLIVVQIVCV